MVEEGKVGWAGQWSAHLCRSCQEDDKQMVFPERLQGRKGGGEQTQANSDPVTLVTAGGTSRTILIWTTPSHIAK